jgi:hypothetical protein
MPRGRVAGPRGIAARCGKSIWTAVLQIFLEGFDLFIRFVVDDPIRFLELTDQLLAISGYDFEVIVRQLSPLRFYLAFVLRPVSFDDFPVHGFLQLSGNRQTDDCIAIDDGLYAA